MCQNKICLIYQYLLFKGDKFHEERENAIYHIRQKRYVPDSDFVRVYKSFIRAEVFDEIQRDIFNLLK